MAQVEMKHEYLAPAQILEAEVERLGIPKPQLPLVPLADQLLGTWVNCNHQTRSLVRLVIEPVGQEVTLHAFGACSPNPCDWLKVPGMIYEENVTSRNVIAFTGLYKFNFAQVILTGHLLEGALMVESFTHFTDSSGRSDFYSLDVMTK